jgi:hypothetical protein
MSLVGNLFYDALSVTTLYSVDDRVISEWWWIGKDLVGSGCGLILKYYPGIREEELRKTTEALNQDSQSPGPGIERRIFPIRSRIVNHSTTTFGFIMCENTY